MVLGWEGRGNEPTQADARPGTVMTGKKLNLRFRWITYRNVRVGGVATVASQRCIPGRVGVA